MVAEEVKLPAGTFNSTESAVKVHSVPDGQSAVVPHANKSVPFKAWLTLAAVRIGDPIPVKLSMVNSRAFANELRSHSFVSMVSVLSSASIKNSRGLLSPCSTTSQKRCAFVEAFLSRPSANPSEEATDFPMENPLMP